MNQMTRTKTPSYRAMSTSMSARAQQRRARRAPYQRNMAHPNRESPFLLPGSAPTLRAERRPSRSTRKGSGSLLHPDIATRLPRRFRSRPDTESRLEARSSHRRLHERPAHHLRAHQYTTKRVSSFRDARTLASWWDETRRGNSFPASWSDV